MRIGIDLLWVRPGICGGTESYIRNLLYGFAQYNPQNEYILFMAEDNAESFRHYEVHGNITLRICPVKCHRQWKRILWENIHMDRYARKEQVDLMFIPVYSKPRSRKNGIPYTCVIHDLQAKHYPEYFTFARRLFMNWAWRHTCKTAKNVIVSSLYGREDLIKNYPFVSDKVRVVYDPIISKNSNTEAEALLNKYGVESGRYFYCVSSLLPHKNLETILQVMKNWAGEEKLVLSGVGEQNNELEGKIREYRLQDKLVLTGFVSDAERDCLYENSKLFLYPSVFEGFGMPPIEAMQKGKTVVMTEKTCLKEVTKGKAVYVREPYSVEEWEEKIKYAMTLPEKKVEFEEYALETVVKEYCGVFLEAL